MAASKVKRDKKAPGGEGALPKLKALYQFMLDNSLDALELDEAGSHVKLVRRSQAPAAIPTPVMTAGAALAPATAHQTPAPQPQSAGAELPPGAVALKSSMMGIFYRAPTPSSPPFVKDGDTVKAGHVLCMIEAMKVFNEIKADFPCKVIKVLLENGKPVKSGQDIFIVARI